MAEAARRATAVRLAVLLIGLALVAGLISTIGAPFEAGVAPPPLAIWGPIAAIWVWADLRGASSRS